MLQIYQRLRRHQGLQCWWPGESSYEVVVGCILTQNTNWGNVGKSIANLKAVDLLHPAKILDIPLDWLIELIRPTGFPTQKPLRLKAISQWWLGAIGDDVKPLAYFAEADWGSDTGTLRIPYPPLTTRNLNDVRNELLAIKGVGPETADAILLYALGLPTFVVDAYTNRVFSRVGLVTASIAYEELRHLFQSILPVYVPLYSDYHAQITTLAKNHCLSKPRCRGCPLGEICQTNLVANNKAD